jgi:hypothetical protein
MPHNSREIIEGYTLEIISRSQAIQERCRRLLSKDFASQAPIALAKTIERICQYLEEATKALYGLINWESINSEELESFLYRLRDTDAIIRRLGADVRYVDGARTQRLPWSIIRAVEKFIKVLVPEITIMLRPQWKYNYSIAATDLRKRYYSDLDEYQDLLPNKPLEKYVFQDFKQPFHIISFPSLERKNILLHCLLSHEIGHLFSVSYLNKSHSDFLKNVSTKIGNIVKGKYFDFNNLPLFKHNQIQKEIQYEINRAEFVWKTGLAEVLSDIVGTLLFGTNR